MPFDAVYFGTRKMAASARFSQSTDTKLRSITSYKTAVCMFTVAISLLKQLTALLVNWS